MFTHPKTYDVIVVGAGHAGVEAALAASRMGACTLLTTMDLDTIGKMSCNPAIGGLAKGHIVREIDALGGQMGLTTDATGIQFRMLNRKKGPAVWAPRAQCDKKAYQYAMKAVCERQSSLDVRQAQASALIVEGDQIKGIETSMGVQFLGTCVIITTGTFLKALMHVGESQQRGGRGGEPAAYGLSDSLNRLGFELERLKTGTPPRLNRHSINWKELTVQEGDQPTPPFSYVHEASYADHVVLEAKFEADGVVFHVEQNDRGWRMADCRIPPKGLQTSKMKSKRLPKIRNPKSEIRNSPWSPPLRQLPCHLTSTTLRTEEIIRANLHRSPMYSGQIQSTGPRYCPSIEDKYVKFPDKETHQIFLEPEGLNTDEIYVNGCSTSLPYDVQIDLVHSIKGLENAEIMRAGYAVEYDYAPPTQLLPWLETKRVKNLFFAGQLNGTTGYEEAAAQGFVAGINAALRIQGKKPYTFSRADSYIGVLVDDLVTKGTQEPYRMFTSRAEYRLLLRQDNADERLTALGFEWGLISKERHGLFQDKLKRIASLRETLKTKRLKGVTLQQWLRRPEVNLDDLIMRAPEWLADIPDDLKASIEMDIKYEGYIARDMAHVERLKKTENQPIPEHMNFQEIRALRRETREKLHKIRPQTIGQATRISGVTPADIGVLLVWMKKLSMKPQGSDSVM